MDVQCTMYKKPDNKVTTRCKDASSGRPLSFYKGSLLLPVSCVPCANKHHIPLALRHILRSLYQTYVFPSFSCPTRTGMHAPAAVLLQPRCEPINGAAGSDFKVKDLHFDPEYDELILL